MGNPSDEVTRAMEQAVNAVAGTAVATQEQVEQLAAQQSQHEQAIKQIVEHITKSGPYAQRAGGDSREREMERMLKVHTPTPQERHTLWILLTDFVEQLQLLNITALEQKAVLLDWSHIISVSQSQGHEEWTWTRQLKLAAKILSFKSRGDNPLVGYTERSSWFQTMRKEEQVIRTPNQISPDNTGFFGSMLTGRR